MNKALRGVLIGGGIAATLDIVYAFVMSAQAGRSPTWVLQFVASGLLGAESFESGMPAATLGLLAHFGILLAAAALYYAASQRLPLLRQRAVICGLLFGVGVYLFMNFVVLPLSAVPYKLAYTPSRLAQGFVSHAVLVGLPIALAIRRYGAASA
jgi:hypothetical protein